LSAENRRRLRASSSDGFCVGLHRASDSWSDEKHPIIIIIIIIKKKKKKKEDHNVCIEACEACKVHLVSGEHASGC